MEHANIWGRLRAAMKAEVPADTLLAYRRAGITVYDMLKHVEDKRLDLKIEGTDPWAVAPATQAELLCAWNAFILQTLGDQFLDADARADPATIGFVPVVTAQQVLSLYKQVEPWLSRARQAHESPAYRLDVHVPAELPAWAEVEPCPSAHLDAILAATQAIRSQAEAALGTFAQAASAEHQAGTQRLRQVLADASSKADYAQQLWSGHVSGDLHEQIEQYLKGAAERYYLLGQLLAMPQLLDVAAQPQATPANSPAGSLTLPLPGQAGFDPWCLTDPHTRTQWQRDPKARQAIANLWRFDTHPQLTLHIQARINAALAQGEVAYATTPAGEALGNYYCCPWSAIYVVRHPVSIGGRNLRAMEEFTYDVSAEGIRQGEPFKRDILVAHFQSSTDVDYCDPTESKHDDD